MKGVAPLPASTRGTVKVMKKPCGGGVEVAFEVQELQADHRPEVDGESAAGAREGLPLHLSEVEQQWRKRCREVGAEYIPPTGTELDQAIKNPRRTKALAQGRYRSMRARIASAVARAAKRNAAHERVAEDKRDAERREAAIQEKRATERAVAEEASIRRAKVRPRVSTNNRNVPSS